MTFEGGRLDLYPLWADVLALLAQHPEGLSAEQLLLLLYGDEGKLSTLKATLSKVRRLLPITRPPYRIGVPFEADFLTVEALLRKGHLRAGLELYKGPLLPESNAPGITEMRSTLEELLRQAALTSQDPDALAEPVRAFWRRLGAVGGEPSGLARARTRGERWLLPCRSGSWRRGLRDAERFPKQRNDTREQGNYTKIALGKYAETTQLGASTISLILRSTATLHSA